MKKITSYFIMIMYILLLLFNFITFSVLAWDEENIVDWEDYSVYDINGIGSFYTWQRTTGDEGYVVVHTVNDSTKSLYLRIQGDGDAVGNSDPYDDIEFYFEYDDTIFINSTKIHIQFQGYSPQTTDYNAIQFEFEKNNVDQAIIGVCIGDLVSSNKINIYCKNANGTIKNIYDATLDAQSSMVDMYLTVEYRDETEWGSRLWYNATWNGNDTLAGSISDTMRIFEGIWDYYDEIFLNSLGDTITYHDNYNRLTSYLGCIHIRQTGYAETDEPSINGRIYFNFYDLETGKKMRLAGSSVTKAQLLDEYRAVQGQFKSDLWTGEYTSYWYPSDGELDINFVSGALYYFNLSGKYGENYVVGIVDGDFKQFQSINKSYVVYDENIYNIYLVPLGYGGQPEFYNCHNDHFVTYWRFPFEFGQIYLNWCLTNTTYYLNQPVRLQYVTPSESQLIYWQLSTQNWYITVGYYDPWPFWTEIQRFKQKDGDFDLLGTSYFGYLNWTVTNPPYHNYAKEYEIRFRNDGCFGEYNGLKFTVLSELWTPTGSIISVDPQNPVLYQDVDVTFNANGSGVLQFEHIPTGIKTFVEFDYSDTNQIITFTPDKVGAWAVNILVDSVLDPFEENFTLVGNTGYFNCSGTEEGYPSYGTEYLWIPSPKRFILGYSQISIYYQTFKDNSYINITTPYNETSPLSTKIDTAGYGVYNFSLSDIHDLDIGIYNVTGDFNNTYYSQFSIIADEQNWIEFTKNIYEVGQHFECHISHDRRVVLIFSKYDSAEDEYIPQGTDYVLTEYQDNFNTITIPFTNAEPTTGKWKVEMYELNRRVRINKQAEWFCNVVSEGTLSIPESTDLALIISDIDPLFKGLIGLAICLGCLFLPYGVNKVTKMEHIPPVIYAVCMGAGAVSSMIFGFWKLEYAFFICMMGGIGVLITWIAEKRKV